MKTKTTLLILSFFLTFGLLQAQTQREVRSLGAFNAVKVSNAIKVELVKGSENKAELTVSGIELGKVETSIVDETLEIRLARGNFRNHNVEVKITYKDIQGIEALTSARVIAKSPIEASEAYLFASTSAYLEAEVEADVLNIEAATNAKIFVTGKVEKLGLRAFTNAEIDGQNLRANQVEVMANTAATVYFRTTGIIEGSAATAAKIYYKGNPKEINVKTSTGGTISRH
ncbi:head GIN domain-containing protein [Cecembia calidifontis]|uniref:Putative autotransporter adhesin-like protein n=1 Tax=Cecembia calidifontis TaxID=1187080 RepID=A0A4V2F612_9BACT|nr:head GIN domain-containing protein [Cecembia calidifontis]RZS94709.1 putative autotransporter adhesin-like protein [Cecembia calidifontis]